MNFSGFKNYIREVNFIVGKEKFSLLWLIPLFLVLSILDLLGIGLVASFVTMLVNPDFLSARLSAYFPDTVKYFENTQDLILVLCVVIAAVFVLKAILAIFVNRKILDICYEFAVKLRTYLMYAYQEMEYTDYLSRNSSEYVYNIQTIAGQFAVAIMQSILRIISDGVIAIFILTFLAILDMVTLGTLLILLLSVVYGYDKLFRKRVNVYGESANIYSSKMVQNIQEGMIGFRENRVYGITDYFSQAVYDSADGLAHARVRSSIITTSSKYIVELLLVIFVVLLVLITMLLQKDMQMLLAIVTAFAVAAMRLMPSVNQMLSCLTKLRVGRHTVHLLYKDLKKISSNKNVEAFEEFNARYKTKIKNTNYVSTPFQSIELKNVSFTYPAGDATALKNIDLKILKGDAVGIIGESGSGKTTLIDVLLGLLQPQEGEIKYNGVPVTDLMNWQSQVAYLPQDIFVTDDTLRRNIALGILDDEIDDLKVMDALHKARLGELLKNLSQGLDTVIGERGTRLSGGQRQRIAIARAYYHGRKVLVMDESTSALDSNTEKEIVDEINHLKGEVTVIVIAHRVTTLKYCDVIYEMNSGEIIRNGDYASVIG